MCVQKESGNLEDKEVYKPFKEASFRETMLLWGNSGEEDALLVKDCNSAEVLRCNREDRRIQMLSKLRAPIQTSKHLVPNNSHLQSSNSSSSRLRLSSTSLEMLPELIRISFRLQRAWRLTTKPLGHQASSPWTIALERFRASIFPKDQR